MPKSPMPAALLWAGGAPPSGGGAPAPAATFTPRSCPTTYGVLITSYKPYRLPAKGAYFKDGPGGTMTASVTHATTISYGLSSSLEVSLSYLIASAKSDVDVHIEKSVAVTTGHTYSHDISAHKYGNLQYGSSGYKVGWQSNRTNPNCSNTVLATGTATLPATSVGWHYWETKS